VGSFAYVDGREGKTSVLPDSDLDLKLEWAEGGSSDYVKVNRLQRSNGNDFANIKKRLQQEAEQRLRQQQEEERQRQARCPLSPLPVSLDRSNPPPNPPLLPPGEGSSSSQAQGDR